MAQQLGLCLEDLVPANAEKETPASNDSIPVVIPIVAAIATVVLILLMWILCRRRKKLSAASKAAWLEASLSSGASNNGKNSFTMGAVNPPPAYQTSAGGFDSQQYMARPDYGRTPSYTEEVYSFAPESDGGPGLDDPEWQARERELQARVELELEKKRFEIKRAKYEAKLRAHIQNRESRTEDDEEYLEEDHGFEESEDSPSPVRTPKKYAHKRSRSIEERSVDNARRPAGRKNESLPRNSALVAESPDTLNTPTSGKMSGIKAWVNSPVCLLLSFPGYC